MHMAKRGPAPRGEYVNKSKVFSTRLRPDTLDALKVAAEKSGRSLSQEVEHRLRRSFDFDGKVSDAFGDWSIYSLMRMIATAMTASFNPKTGASWADDPYVFNQAVERTNV